MKKISLFAVLFSACLAGSLTSNMSTLSADPVTSYYTETPLSQVATQDRLHWYANYEQAAELAQKEGKPLLLYFTGSDWCGWCKKMDSEIFSSPEFFDAIGDRLIFVKIDFPLNHKLPQDRAQRNNTLKQQYGVTGYPTVVLLDPDSNFIAKTGYRAGGPREYANYLLGFLIK